LTVQRLQKKKKGGWQYEDDRNTHKSSPWGGERGYPVAKGKSLPKRERRQGTGKEKREMEKTTGGKS